MKNIAYSLIMTFLFGILCPSYQAYASGKEFSIVLEKQQNRAKLNDDLVIRLSNSKTFESLYNAMFIFGFLASDKLLTKTVEQQKLIFNNLEQLTNTKEANFNDLFSAFDLQENKLLGERVNKTKEKLRIEFPDLFVLDQVEGNEVITKAIEKGNFENKAYILLDGNECIANAEKSRTICQTQNKWYKYVAGGVVKGCIVAALVCFAGAIVFSFGTAGAGTPVALLGIFTGCALTAGGIFAAFNNTLTACDTAYNGAENNCLTRFGNTITGGGAN